MNPAQPPPPSGQPPRPMGMPPQNQPPPPNAIRPQPPMPNGMRPPPPQMMGHPPYGQIPPQAQPPPQPPAPMVNSNGQPFGGYASVPQGQNRTAMAAKPPVANQPPQKKKNTVRIYDDEKFSMEEKRAMHPKYSAQLSKRVGELSDSIEARLMQLSAET